MQITRLTVLQRVKNASTTKQKFHLLQDALVISLHSVTPPDRWAGGGATLPHRAASLQCPNDDPWPSHPPSSACNPPHFSIPAHPCPRPSSVGVIRRLKIGYTLSKIEMEPDDCEEGAGEETESSERWVIDMTKSKHKTRLVWGATLDALPDRVPRPPPDAHRLSPVAFTDRASLPYHSWSLR